mmetsp:Transcript_55195/g.170957  ORF Transcript_55195/g.170957 Transcript_55195/m.170957 type:complete len:299 (-) Transcript_55195:1065-1961(-)
MLVAGVVAHAVDLRLRQVLGGLLPVLLRCAPHGLAPRVAGGARGALPAVLALAGACPHSHAGRRGGVVRRENRRQGAGGPLLCQAGRGRCDRLSELHSGLLSCGGGDFRGAGSCAVRRLPLPVGGQAGRGVGPHALARPGDQPRREEEAAALGGGAAKRPCGEGYDKEVGSEASTGQGAGAAGEGQVQAAEEEVGGAGNQPDVAHQRQVEAPPPRPGPAHAAAGSASLRHGLASHRGGEELCHWSGSGLVHDWPRHLGPHHLWLGRRQVPDLLGARGDRRARLHARHGQRVCLRAAHA